MVDPIVDSFLLNIKMNMNSYKEFIIIILYTSSMTPSDDILKIYISPEYNTLRMFYHARVEQHNNMIDTDPFADSGFDLGINIGEIKSLSEYVPQCGPVTVFL
jgi:hypothetical protein